MNEAQFLAQKGSLNSLIADYLAQKDIDLTSKSNCIRLLAILDKYTFNNRFEMKGLLSHTIVDSIELDYSITEKFMYFDKHI